MDEIKKQGGHRPGAGRPKKQSEKKQTYHVYLIPSPNNTIVDKYGSLTKALEYLAGKEK